MAYAFNDDKSKVDLKDVFVSGNAFTNSGYSINPGSTKTLRFACPVNGIIVQIQDLQFYIGNDTWAGSNTLEVVKMTWEDKFIDVTVKNVTNSPVTIAQSATSYPFLTSTFASVLYIPK